MANQPGLSIVIPAYNEELGIGTVLQQLQQTMIDNGLVYELIVVDDGSQDGTAEVAKQHPGVTVLQHIGWSTRLSHWMKGAIRRQLMLGTRPAPLRFRRTIR